MPEFVDYLRKNGLHYIPIIDPAISSSEKLGTYKPYEIGLEMNVFIQNISGDPFEGRVWTNGKCVWPDFTNPKVIFFFLFYLHILLIGFNNQCNFFLANYIKNLIKYLVKIQKSYVVSAFLLDLVSNIFFAKLRNSFM